MTRALTPAAIDWRRAMIDAWSARADERRATGGQLNETIAASLESIVSRLRDEIAAAPAHRPQIVRVAPSASIAAPVDDVEDLQRRIDAIEPANYPGTTIVMGNGPIVTGLRQVIQARLAALLGQLAPIAPVAVPAALLPPPEALPFTTGPQLDLFVVIA